MGGGRGEGVGVVSWVEVSVFGMELAVGVVVAVARMERNMAVEGVRVVAEVRLHRS